MNSPSFNPLYDEMCEVCEGVGRLCNACDGVEGSEDIPCDCSCPELVHCEDCRGLGYYDDFDDEEDDPDEEDDEDSEDLPCDLCGGVGEIETDDGDLEDCECIEEDLDEFSDE